MVYIYSYFDFVSYEHLFRTYGIGFFPTTSLILMNVCTSSPSNAVFYAAISFAGRRQNINCINMSKKIVGISY